jgi:hypothetical protein
MKLGHFYNCGVIDSLLDLSFNRIRSEKMYQNIYEYMYDPPLDSDLNKILSKKKLTKKRKSV